MPRSPKLETKGNLRIMRYSTRFIVLCRKLVNLGRIFMYKNIYKYMSTTLSIITGCRRRHTIKVIKTLCVAFEAAVARLFSPYSRLLRAKELSLFARILASPSSAPNVTFLHFPSTHWAHTFHPSRPKLHHALRCNDKRLWIVW